MAFNTGNFIRRALITVLAGPGILAVIYLGGYYILALVYGLVFLSLREYYQLVKNKGYSPVPTSGVLAGLAIITAFQFGPGFTIPILIVFVAAVFLEEVFKNERQNILEHLGVNAFGVFYLALMPAHIVVYYQREVIQLPGLEHGNLWLMGVVLLIWCFDIFSYLVGSWLGRHPMFPRLSPKKTWEGLAGGVIGLALVSPFLFMTINGDALTLDYAAVPILIAASALGGDLFESLLKRDAGVKDSSNLIPGHGGVLDRFDSLLVGVPVLYWYLHFTRTLF